MTGCCEQATQNRKPDAPHSDLRLWEDSHGEADAAQKGAWTIVVLLFFFMLINFADKVIIGLAGVPIMKDLALTPRGVRAGQLQLLLPVLAVGDRHRFSR